MSPTFKLSLRFIIEYENNTYIKNHFFFYKSYFDCGCDDTYNINCDCIKKEIDRKIKDILSQEINEYTLEMIIDTDEYGNNAFITNYKFPLTLEQLKKANIIKEVFESP